MIENAGQFTLWQRVTQTAQSWFGSGALTAQTVQSDEQSRAAAQAKQNSAGSESVKKHVSPDPQQILEAALNLNDSLRATPNNGRNMNASGSLNTLVVKLTPTEKRTEKKSVRRNSGRLFVPDHAASWTQHALAYIGVKKYSKAIECTEEALRLDPQNGAAWQCRGLALLEMRRAPEAAQAFQRAVALQPHDPEAWFGFGRALLQMEMYQQAINSFVRTLEMQPEHVAALLAKAQTHFLLQQFAPACEAYAALIKHQPDDSNVWCQYGESLVGAGQHDAAQECFEHVTRVAPDLADNWLRLGNLLCQMGRAEEALDKYQKALEIAPDDQDIWFNRGLAYTELGKSEDAAKSFQQVLSLNEKDASARYQLALTHLQRFIEALEQGRVFNAKEHWQIAVNHGRQTVLADWYAQELYYLQTAAALGHQRLVKALIQRLAGNDLLAPLNCALDYLLTQDEETVSSLPVNIRRQVESMINLLNPMSFCAAK